MLDLMQLTDSVTTLKQISSSYEQLLNKLEIKSLKDLLTYFPRKYENATAIDQISDIFLEPNEKKDYILKVNVLKFTNAYLRSRKTLQRAELNDNSGSIKAMWFNQPYLEQALKGNAKFLMKGRIRSKGKTITFYPNIYEPIIEDRENVHLGRIVPEYSLTEGVSRKWFRNRIKYLIDNIDSIDIPNELAYFIDDKTLKQSIAQLHFPESFDAVKLAEQKLSLMELTNIQLQLEEKRLRNKKFKAPIIGKENEELIDNFIKRLPYDLTSDQSSIITHLVKKIEARQLLNELIQGDVGSGKTIVAAIVALVVANSGYQVAIFTPTTILAKQHFKTFTELFSQNPDIKIEFITSENKKTKDADILIGTSAILARKTNLIKNLGCVIVDEQHKFGVTQREELLEPFQQSINTSQFPHYINMTATPIPRTIAQTFFGDLEISSIKTKPKDRKPVKTFLIEEKKRLGCLEWIEEEVKKGNQAYWVCPLISESEKLEIASAEEIYKKLKKLKKNIRFGLLHGQMKQTEKSKIMNSFVSGEIDILVSTTVIEVGVDVPNATIMVIESAERFGLAQLHQIRGRVGRSGKQSWCFLFQSSISPTSNERLTFLANNFDGSKIAEFDLKTRGPGEVYGQRQTGVPNLKIAKLNDIELINKSRIIAEKLYNDGVRKIELFS